MKGLLSGIASGAVAAVALCVGMLSLVPRVEMGPSGREPSPPAALSGSEAGGTSNASSSDAEAGAPANIVLAEDRADTAGTGATPDMAPTRPAPFRPAPFRLATLTPPGADDATHVSAREWRSEITDHATPGRPSAPRSGRKGAPPAFAAAPDRGSVRVSDVGVSRSRVQTVSPKLGDPPVGMTIASGREGPATKADAPKPEGLITTDERPSPFDTPTVPPVSSSGKMMAAELQRESDGGPVGTSPVKIVSGGGQAPASVAISQRLGRANAAPAASGEDAFRGRQSDASVAEQRIEGPPKLPSLWPMSQVEDPPAAVVTQSRIGKTRNIVSPGPVEAPGAEAAPPDVGDQPTAPRSPRAARDLPELSEAPERSARNTASATPQLATFSSSGTPTGAAPPGPDALVRNAVPVGNTGGRPRMAILLLDAQDAPIVESPRLSAAIPAGVPDAAARARAWREAGQEVVLVPALDGRTPEEVVRSLEASFDAVPGAAALMPPAGDGFAGNAGMAQRVATRIAESGHGLVTGPSVFDAAARAARRHDVPTLRVQNRVDADGRDARTIARFLDGAAFDAGRRGEIVVLAANSEATRTALDAWTRGSRVSSVALVPVSALLLDR